MSERELLTKLVLLSSENVRLKEKKGLVEKMKIYVSDLVEIQSLEQKED